MIAKVEKGKNTLKKNEFAIQACTLFPRHQITLRRGKEHERSVGAEVNQPQPRPAEGKTGEGEIVSRSGNLALIVL